MCIFGKKKHESPKAISAMDETELDALNRKINEKRKAEEKRVDLERLAELGEAMDTEEVTTLIKVFVKKYGTDFVFRAMIPFLLNEAKEEDDE